MRTSGGIIAQTGDPEIANDGIGDLFTFFREGDYVDLDTVERLDEL